jgi:hypothetical protein
MESAKTNNHDKHYFQTKISTESLMKARIMCWVYFSSHFTFVAFKMIQLPAEHNSLSNILFNLIGCLTMMLLFLVSYKRDLKYVLHLCYIQIAFNIVILWDPWNRASFRSKQYTNMVHILNQHLVLKKLITLNGIEHRNCIYFFISMCFVLMYGATNFHTYQSEGSLEFEQSVMIQNGMAFMLGSFTFNLQFYFLKLDFFNLFEQTH